jgi:hypothetical protein
VQDTIMPWRIESKRRALGRAVIGVIPRKRHKRSKVHASGERLRR